MSLLVIPSLCHTLSPSTSVFWQGCISSLAVLLSVCGGVKVGESRGTSEYINSHQKANGAEWRLGALSCEWHWAAVWVYHHSITARMSSGITRRQTRAHTLTAYTINIQRQTEPHSLACTNILLGVCQWRVKCNQSLSIFLLSFLAFKCFSQWLSRRLVFHWPQFGFNCLSFEMKSPEYWYCWMRRSFTGA